ncbi:hypothetical protein ACHAWF_008286 [Thalassiosira exigua]
MTLSDRQRALLARLESDYANGLSSAEAARRRAGDGGGLNGVRPPLDCPKWVCCLLPCIKHVPSMKQFRLVQPDDAEVLRDGTWIRYDHASLVVGDVVRLVEGDVVPADCAVMSLGMDRAEGATDERSELTVDSRLVTGEAKPRQIAPRRSDGSVDGEALWYGSRVLEGACVAVVTATGSRTVLAKLIREGRWPPSADLSEEVEEINRMENEDLEAGIALTPVS